MIGERPAEPPSLHEELQSMGEQLDKLIEQVLDGSVEPERAQAVCALYETRLDLIEAVLLWGPPRGSHV